MKYKIVYVGIKNKKGIEKELPFLSGSAFKAGDKVIVEGFADPVIVKKYVEFDEITVPYNIQTLKNVISEYKDLVLDMTILMDKEFYFPLYHLEKMVMKLDSVYDVHFIDKLVISNKGSESLKDFKLSVSFNDEAFHDFVYDIGILDGKSKMPVNGIVPRVDLAKYNFIEPKTITASFQVIKDDKIIDRRELDFKAMPLFVMPNDFKYDKRYALKYVSDYNLKLALSYDVKTVSDLFDSLKPLKLKLLNDEKVLLPYETLKNSAGNRLSVAILIALYMKAYNLNPMFIFSDNLVYVGSYGSEYPDISSKERLQQAIEEEKIIVFDPTDICDSTIYDRSRINSLEAIKKATNVICVIASDYDNSPFSPVDYDDLSDTEISYTESPLADDELDRFTSWERKLLDLTEMNPLISLKIKDTNTVRIVSNDNIADIIKKYASFNISNILSADSAQEYLCGELNLTKDDIGEGIIGLGSQKTMTDIISKNKKSIDETGSSILYMTLGLLNFTKKNEAVGYAPFLILPLRITSNRKKEFKVSYDYDDLMVNEAFFEYYHTINPYESFEDLYNVDLSARYQDICKVFESYNLDDVKLDKDVFLITSMSFSHYIMWKDIKERRESLSRNRFVSSFIKNESLVQNSGFNKLVPINDREKYRSFCAPLSYDSTQLDAILSSMDGESFILDGPPGTGKSQTIVNVITNAIYNGKTVLFVAMKKAALDVVYDRLKSLGLEDFVLELHSAHANKTDFFAKLKNVMDKEKSSLSNSFDETCFELEAKRSEIENVLAKMHNKRFYYSLYDAIVCYQNYISACEKDLMPDVLYSLSESNNKNILELIDDIVYLSDTVTDFDSTVLKALDVTEIGFYDKEKFYKAFTDLNFSFTRYYKDTLNFVEGLKINVPFKNECIKELLNTADIALNDKPFVNYLNQYLKGIDEKRIEDTLQKAIHLHEFTGSHKYYMYKGLQNTDYESAIEDLSRDEAFFKKLSTNNNYKKMLKEHLLANTKIDKPLITYFEEIEDFGDTFKAISKNAKEFERITGLNILEHINDIESVKASYDASVRLARAIKSFELKYNLVGMDNIIMTILNDDASNQLYLRMHQSFEKHSSEFERINDMFKINYQVFSEYDDEFDRFKTFTDGITHVGFNDVINMAKLNSLIERLNEYKLEPLSIALKSSNIKVKDLKRSYYKSISKGYLRLYFEDDDINYFTAGMFDSSVKKYKSLIDDYSKYSLDALKLKAYEVIAEAPSKLPEASPIGKLKKATQSARGMSVRKALHDYEALIRAYFPVMLMSPLSAAQYLGGKEFAMSKKYDLVVFDEASQIPLHEAIGAISKGESLIVAGDEMQMPPSNYFKAAVSDELDEDSDSLLSECLAIGLDRKRLKFHYRSHHESLIEFSNINFYNSELNTFPSFDSDSFKVELKTLDVEKKSSGMTELEANAILDELTKIYSNPDTSNKSVGIIVFNINEVEYLEGIVNKFLEKNKEIYAKINAVEDTKGEALFIKSLENVQGDERDIIILSVGFTKNSLGHPYINGPLVRTNGEKRLNVALSRSKDKMIVISTVNYLDFEADEKIRANGTKILKKFLKYASEKNELEEATSSCGQIAQLIQKDLEKMGYTSRLSVGISRFKVDLGILAPDGTYTLGVLIDPKLDDDVTLRDIISVKEQMLERLGWNIVRVYSLDYYKDKDRLIERIVSSIKNPFVGKLLEENKPKEKELYDIRPYKETIIGSIAYDRRFGFAQLESYIDVIIKTESPISDNKIKTIIRDKAGLKVLSSNMEELIDNALQNKNFTFDQGYKFYWSSDSNFIDYFRNAGKRGINDIAREELANALSQIMKNNEFLTKDELYDKMIEVFKFEYSMDPQELKKRFEYVYKYAMDNNLL